ncbi:two-component system, NarL family, captular synthesis response regulator RcsB [Izhakiella capsodis]|uniref:Two-component system, NarL family, captular synthesis response regulator RcsB n=1 Tax=Izhakiella capsodis TaxID=1367852 RepID=A0A1I4XGH5_9GAMM|nr:response regulator transcription factor [Izhakiella capsodis]SFN24400.1 two-component system, NarL family, captular synthesis response regulator RcsB [Izhakiella capsodis]
MNNVISLTQDPVLSGTLPADSAGDGVLIMDACPATALGIKQILVESCGITDAIHYVQSLAGISSRVASAPPALLIMDICGEKERMLDGLRLLAHLNEVCPTMKIIVCTDFNDDRILEMLISSKANGILLKHEPSLALAQCVSKCLAGERQWLSPKVQRLYVKTTPKNTALTARELDVLAHLFSGLSVSRVAQALHRDIRTVSTHKRNAMMKLGFHNDSELFSRGTWMAQIGPATGL